jgi:hypothetical protein
MSNDDKKPPIRLYEQRLRFTPDGTQFSNEPTKEGRERFRELEQAKEERAASAMRKDNVRQAFAKHAKMATSEKTKFKRAEKKDRGDFER